MNELVGILFALWAATTSGPAITGRTLPVAWPDRPDVLAYVTCRDDGSTTITWSEGSIPLYAIVHELAHVYDCQDDGLLNGSPGHPYGEWEAGELEQYCPPALVELNAGEWYACAVTRRGRLR